MLICRTLALLLALLVVRPAAAQSTFATVSGLITDTQRAALRDVPIRAENAETGLVRQTVSDASGGYRLAGLPVGTYVIVAEQQGFQPATRRVTLNVGRNVRLDVTLELVGRVETVTVTATAPIISTRSSTVGEVVDVARVQAFPLNGRQLANLAVTVAGVGIGYHSEITKSAQYSPQISGGNGRNINYVVDGGDNNDDTVGGLLQNFPLEAVQEFTVLTQRFDSEYGRSNGGVLNVVTRSGTNQRHGSWFTLARDEAMNARTFTEKLNGADKQGYQRYQFGGGIGGPIVLNRTHYFAAYERTHQDTKQVVNTQGVFPAEDGIFDLSVREHLFTAKVTTTLGPRHYVALRYGRNHITQPSGAAPNIAPSAWATSTNSFHSLNLNHNWVAGASLLNESMVQFSSFDNNTPASSSGPAYAFPNLVRGGTNATAPQRTEQIKWQFRDDVSWTTTAGVGVSHDLRGGVNWIHEPRLRVFAGGGTQGLYTMAENTLAGPVMDVQVYGNNPTSNFPLEQFGVYMQDDWRVTDRLTLNLGVRWDYVHGFPLDQSGSANFQAMQQAGAEGRFAGTLLDEFGQAPRNDLDNVQPRLGAVFDLFGDGRDVIRGGWGVYTDFGYIASNMLTASFESNNAGIVFWVNDPTGIRKADGTFFRAGDPLSTIEFRNMVTNGIAPTGEVVSPLLEQPYSRQTSVGWSHQLNASTVLSADYVRVDGRDLNMRVRPNVRVDGVRLLAGINIFPPNSTAFRTALSKGSSRYDGLILSFRRRLSDGVDASASYTIATATSDVGTAYDEIAQNLIQDIRDPFGNAQQGPSVRTDSRHMITISGIVRTRWDVQVAPIFHYRSALPVFTFDGRDLNGDGNFNDRTPVAYRYTGIDANNLATFEEDGSCGTVNCSRRAGFSQLNLRVSKPFAIGHVQIEAIGEIFNLFNAKNPALALSQRRLTASGSANSTFMQPGAYAGDVGQPEQLVGQVGFRLTF